jgi:hypothetical protein
MNKTKPFLLPLIVFLLLAAATVAASRLPFPWAGLPLASCYPRCFCEAFTPGGIVEPLSSWSNFFYIGLGLFLVGTAGAAARDPRRNRMTARPGYIRGFGAAVAGIGVTSLFFHVTLTQVGRWLDYLGMYAFAAYALLYGVARLRRWGDAPFVAAFAVLAAALGALWIFVPGARRPALGALIAGVVLVEAVAHRIRRPLRIRTRYLAAALVCFGVALTVNLLDESGALCAPDSLWQWHAVWHFLTAGSTGWLYLYYRSEDEA